MIGNGSGTVSLAKAGSGMLTLQGNNTYTGATSINGGTLTLDSALDGTSYHAYTYVGGNISINNGSTLYVKASKYEFDGKTITFDSNGGGTIYVGGSSIGGSFLVNHSQITIATGGGSQDYIAGTQNINADGSTVTLNVVRGSDPSSDLTISGHFSGDRAGSNIVKTGNGICTLTAGMYNNGSVTVSNGTLQLGTGLANQDGSLNSTSSVTDNAALVYNVAGRQTASNTIGGSGSLAVVGPGMLTLSASNGYSGGTSIQNGTLQLGNSAALGTGALAANGGTLDLAGYSATVTSFSGGASGLVTNSGPTGAVLTVNQAGSTNFSGVFSDGASGSFGLYKTGAGALTINGNQTYSGPTTLNAGYLNVASLTASPVTVQGSGYLTVGGTLGGNVTLATTATAYGIDGTPVLSGSLAVTGVGTWFANGSVLGGVAVQSGGLSLDSGAMLTTPVVNVTGGSIASKASGTLNGSLNYTSASPSTFAGIIQGSGNSVELNNAAATLTLTGSNNTYTGATTVNGGVLYAGAANALSPYSAHFVGAGATAATLDVTAAPQTVAALTIGASGTLNISAANLLTVTGAASFASGSTIDITGTSSITSLPWPLMYYSLLPSGSFSNVIGLPSNNTLAYSSGTLDIISVVSPFSGNGIWGGSSPNWSASANWTDSSGNHGVPGDGSRAAGTDTATFSGSGSTGVTLDISSTVSSVGFSNLNYTLSGANTLTLYGTAGTAGVTVTGSTQAIASAVSLGSSLSVTLNGSGELAISGNVSESPSGQSLTLTGDGTGTLILGGTNSYTGGTYVDAGTMVINNTAALPDDTSLTVGAGGTFIFDPTVSGSAMDVASQQAHAAAGVAPVPEPSTLVLLAAAGIVAAATGWRRRS